MDSFFPMVLAEIDVQSIKYFRFMMPIQDIGRSDVEITIDYGDAADKKHELTCNVWARIGNATIKGFLLSLHIPKPEESEEIESIISALNDNFDFREQLVQFIEFISK